eukprot:jgi/Botrbrau1/20041/Bobra.200_1s0046.1
MPRTPSYLVFKVRACSNQRMRCTRSSLIVAGGVVVVLIWPWSMPSVEDLNAYGSMTSGSMISGSMTSGSTTSGSMTSGSMTSGSMTSGSMTSGSMTSGSMTSGSMTSGSMTSRSMKSIQIQTHVDPHRCVVSGTVSSSHVQGSLHGDNTPGSLGDSAPSPSVDAGCRGQKGALNEPCSAMPVFNENWVQSDEGLRGGDHSCVAYEYVCLDQGMIVMHDPKYNVINGTELPSFDIGREFQGEWAAPR